MDHMDTKGQLTALAAAEAGSILRRRREELGLSRAQVVAQTTVTSAQYLHNLEAGRINPARSKHLPSLAKALGLTPEQQAIILGVRMMQQPVSEAEPPVADVLQPLDLLPALVLASGQIGAWRLGDEVLIVDRGQRTPQLGWTFLLLAVDKTFRLVRCLPGDQGQMMLVGEDQVWSAEEPGVFGRVLHRGQNL